MFSTYYPLLLKAVWELRNAVPFFSYWGLWPLDSPRSSVSFISWGTKCFQLGKCLNCRQASSHPDSSTMKPCCCNRCSKHVASNCLTKMCKGFPEKDLDGRICSKTCKYLSASMLPFQMCKVPIPQALMQTLELSADNKSHGPSPL